MSVIDLREPENICPTEFPEDIHHDCKETIASLERENAELRKRLAEIEEREAACCPEDVGFDEYIEGLKDIIKQMRYALRVALPEARSTHCEKTIAVALKAAER